MIEIKFYSPDYDPEPGLIYSVISARFKDKWIFVRHQKRNTWEIAGGHIEINETSKEAAIRELREETGALNFTIECVATYSVTENHKTGYGRLYFADVSELGQIPDVSEIAEIMLLEQLPENLTHPEVQPHLYRKTQEYLKKKFKS
jgi:8-oxo-dGTP diphosphatase